MVGDGGRRRPERIQLACIPCRQGKLKCNRVYPTCDQCCKRSRDSACSYTERGMRYNAAQQKANTMREKIDRLEHFVNGLRGSEVQPLAATEEAQEAQSTRTTDGAQDALANLTGRLRLSGTGSTQFIGPSHWEAIIEDIADVKNYFDIEDSPASGDDEETVLLSESNVPSLDLHFGLAQTYSKQQLLEALPTKQTMDRLVAAWFNAMDPLRLIVHAPTFQAEYQRFWQQPAQVSTGWLALLFAIGSLGAEVSGEVREDLAVLAQAEDMRRLTVHGLVLADYTALPAYVVEALLLHIKCCLLKHIDVTREIYLRLGLLTRLCTLAGYHRDPSNHPGITPFQAEMRRRVWWFVAKFDILMCYHLGQLSVINQLMVDTTPPSNLPESDLTQGVIPPSRPLSEHTSITAALVYGELTAIFGEVVYSSYSTMRTARTDVAPLQTRLEQARKDLPPQLAMATLEESLLDPPELILARYSLEILHLKALCILYRRYLSIEGHEEERQRCLASAEQLVQHQNTLLEAGQPGAQLAAANVFLRRHVHDFVFAAMLLCVELKTSRRVAQSTNEQWLDRVHSLLQHACELWDAIRVTSPKARHALRAIGRFLGQGMSVHEGASSTASHGRSVAPHEVNGDCHENVNGDLHAPINADASDAVAVDVPEYMMTAAVDFPSLPLDQTFALSDTALPGTSHDWDPLFEDLFGPSYSGVEDPEIIWP